VKVYIRVLEHVLEMKTRLLLLGMKFGKIWNCVREWKRF